MLGRFGRHLNQLEYIRDLVRELVARELKLRYKRSILGVVWAILNPLSYVVRGYRSSFLEHRVPDLSEILILAGFSVAAFVLGGLLFRNTKREFIDVL